MKRKKWPRRNNMTQSTSDEDRQQDTQQTTMKNFLEKLLFLNFRQPKMLNKSRTFVDRNEIENRKTEKEGKKQIEIYICVKMQSLHRFLPIDFCAITQKTCIESKMIFLFFYSWRQKFDFCVSENKQLLWIECDNNKNHLNFVC